MPALAGRAQPSPTGASPACHKSQPIAWVPHAAAKHHRTPHSLNSMPLSPQVPVHRLTAIFVFVGIMSKHLQKAAVNVIGDQACKKFYPIQISSRMVCAGFPQGTIDSCLVSTDWPREPWSWAHRAETSLSPTFPLLGPCPAPSLTAWDLLSPTV